MKTNSKGELIMDNATKRPWILKGKLTITKCGSMTKLDHVIAIVKNQLSGFNLSEERLEQEANARLIVKAVNCHDELVEALRSLVNRFEIDGFKGTFKKCTCNQFLDNNYCRHIQAKQALSKAEAE